MVKEVQGFYCERCRRFMLLADDMNAHLRSITHYRNFLADVKALMSNAAAAEPKETEQTEVSGDAPRERDRKKKETASRLIKIISLQQSEKDAAPAEGEEEYEGNWKRRKTSHDDGEKEDKPTEAPESNANDTMNVPKKSDGEEKYDPLEADAESEEDDVNREAEPEAKKETTSNASNGQEKKMPIDEMWTDADNDDNDAEMGNLIDEADEKDNMEPEKPTQGPQKVERNLNQSAPKMARGRGFVRGRGGPRARRSRR